MGRRARTVVARPLVVIALVLFAAACDGDDDAAPPTSAAITPPPVPTTAAPTATTPTTVPAPPTTAAPTLPAETPAPTVPPSDTTQPGDSPDLTPDERAVVDAMRASWADLNAVLLDPTDDQLVAALPLTRTGDALAAAAQIVAEDRSLGRRSVTHPEFPAWVREYPDTIEIDTESGTAAIEYCRLGSNIYVEVGGNPDETDRVIDDTISTYRERDTFISQNGVWLKSGGTTVEKFKGEMTCPDL